MSQLSGNRVVEEFDIVRAARTNWDDLWQRASDLIFPVRQFTTEHERGARLNDKILDDTGPLAAVTLANGLHGKMVNPASQWFNLVPVVEDLRLDKDVMLWLDDTSLRIFAHLAGDYSNWDSSVHESLLDIAAYGTGIMSHIDTPSGPVFRARGLEQIYLRYDQETGMLTGLYRLIKLTKREAFAKWGDQVDGDIRSAALNGGPDANDKDEYIHCIEVNLQRVADSPLSIHKEWISLYVRRDTGRIVSSGGFDDNPFTPARWAVQSGENYGRGPGVNSIGTMALANAMQVDIIKSAQKSTSPPLEVIANSLEGTINVGSNGITYVRANASRNVLTPINTGSNVAIGKEHLRDVQEQIRKAFFNDLLGPTENLSRTNELAVQVQEQSRQQLLSPSLSRLQKELFTPPIRKTFSSMARRGMLAEPPDALRGPNGFVRGINIEYNGPLAQAQRASEIAGVIQWGGLMGNLAAVDPRAALYIDVDQLAPGTAQSMGIPAKYVRTRAQVDEIVRQNQEAAVREQEATIANTQADTGLKAAKANDLQLAG